MEARLAPVPPLIAPSFLRPFSLSEHITAQLTSVWVTGRRVEMQTSAWLEIKAELPANSETG